MGLPLRRPRKRRWGNELERFRSARLADFALRCTDAPAFVHQHATRGWAYVPVHPMASDSALLNHLGVAPADCREVDCYWHTGRDAVLIRVISASTAARSPGYHASWWNDDPPRLHVHVYVAEREITQAVVEREMERIVSIGVLEVRLGHSHRSRT